MISESCHRPFPFSARISITRESFRGKCSSGFLVALRILSRVCARYFSSIPKQPQTNRSAAKVLGGPDLSGNDFITLSRVLDPEQDVSRTNKFQTNSPKLRLADPQPAASGHAWHPRMRDSVVFIPSATAPLIAPRNIAPAGATFLRPPSLSCRSSAARRQLWIAQVPNKAKASEPSRFSPAIF